MTRRGTNATVSVLETPEDNNLVDDTVEEDKNTTLDNQQMIFPHSVQDSGSNKVVDQDMTLTKVRDTSFESTLDDTCHVL